MTDDDWRNVQAWQSGEWDNMSDYRESQETLQKLQRRVLDQLAPLSDAAGPTVFAVRSIIQEALQRYQALIEEIDNQGDE